MEKRGWGEELVEVLRRGVEQRQGLLNSLHAEQTDCYRLVHGAVEGAPGVSIDRYGPVLLVQTWRAPLREEVLPVLEQVASEAVGAPLRAVWNHRPRKHTDFHRYHPVEPFAAEGRELGLRFDVSPRHPGDDPLLFLDFRVARRHLREVCEGRSVLNLFAYTGGAGVAAAAGGAREVLQVDHARFALEVAQENAARNGVSEVCRALRQDVFPVIRQYAGMKVGRPGLRFRRLPRRTWDVVVLDPPRWATGPFGAVDVVRDYPSLFKPVLGFLDEGGGALLTHHVPSVDLEDWLAIIQRTAEKARRPLRRVEVLKPEADFPSPDGRHPLKVVWVEV